jgi:hypothetical protein
MFAGLSDQGRHTGYAYRRSDGREVNRRQASLFLTSVPLIDGIRARFNPVQSKLIASHVTLIREDEVDDWPLSGEIASTIPIPELTLQFGGPQLDDDGLLYLPCVGGTAEFDRLRETLLGSPAARKHSPHITLIHPRNGKCSDESFREIAGIIKPFEHTFREIAFIEQRNGGAWRTLETFPLLKSRT